MLKLKSYIGYSKSILIVLMILFSLAPCSLKEAVVSIDVSYTKPLNKSRSASPFSSCHPIQAYKDSSSAKVKRQVVAIHGTDDLSSYNVHRFVVGNIDNNYSGITSGNSPPKYILFKRLKIDLYRS